MKVSLTRQEGKFNYQATSESGHSIQMDGAEKIGGTNKGMRPMEVVLAAIGGCSGIDFSLILEKLRQAASKVSIELEAERVKDQVPAVFETILVKFKVEGTDLDPAKVNRAASLAIEKYCSVSKMLEPDVQIGYKAFLNGEEIKK